MVGSGHDHSHGYEAISQSQADLVATKMVFMLLLAIVHVSQHDLLDENGGHLQSDCQICRLAQLDGAGTPLISINAPLFVYLGTLAVLATPFFSRIRVYSRNARAPPSL